MDIVEAIDRIRSAVAQTTVGQFETNWQLQWIVERGVEIISEASRRLPDDFKATHPEIPWRKVAGVGNVLRHDYNEIAASIIWNVARSDLDLLYDACKAEMDRIETRG